MLPTSNGFLFHNALMVHNHLALSKSPGPFTLNFHSSAPGNSRYFFLADSQAFLQDVLGNYEMVLLLLDQSPSAKSILQFMPLLEKYDRGNLGSPISGISRRCGYLLY
jgi:hypothetical protein